MTTADRTELLAALAELADRYGHWRIGQLVANIAGWADVDVWDAEDADLLAAARAHLATSSDREIEGARPISQRQAEPSLSTAPPAALSE